MLGRTLQRKLAGFTLIPTDLPEGDITDETKFDALMAKEKPDAVIHCAAMTAVDNCESNQDLAFKLNALGSANVAAACSRHHARLIAISTDYVFDGRTMNSTSRPGERPFTGKANSPGKS